MSTKNEPEQTKKTLTREEILSENAPAKVYKLTSGKVVNVKYLAFFLVREIYKNIESTTEGNIEHVFTEKVIQWMLRENDQKNFGSFSEEDQKRLIEIAVEEWGCEEEYKSLGEIENPEIRFFQAANQQEKKLSQQLSESIRQLTASLAISISPLKIFQDGIASSLKGILDQFNVVTQVSDVFNNINLRAIDQIRDISALAPPIVEMAGEIAAIQSSMILPFEKTLFESVSGTISSYQTLMRDILPVERFSILPDSVRYYPTIEMHNASIVTGRLITSNIYHHDDEEIITPDNKELLEWLESLDPSFPIMLQGARETIYSRNPDHCRHFASSHRELCTHILHLLAPDNLVKKWTNDPQCFDKERPTRKTRLKYIAKNHNNKTFVDFVIKDFENQMDLLNADEHRKSPNYSEKDLGLLHKRFLSVLGFLRQIVISRS
jgi:hypothetical protein